MQHYFRPRAVRLWAEFENRTEKAPSLAVASGHASDGTSAVEVTLAVRDKPGVRIGCVVRSLLSEGVENLVLRLRLSESTIQDPNRCTKTYAPHGFLQIAHEIVMLGLGVDKESFGSLRARPARVTDVARLNRFFAPGWGF